MQNNEFLFPQAIYLRYLSIINGIHFTQREIDVIACLLHTRGTSKIASLLNIASTTVTTHIQSIKIKLNCHSREGIIDFVERSYHLDNIKKYYSSLITYTTFERQLKACRKLIKNPLPSLILYCKDLQFKETLLSHLVDHLKLAGIESEILRIFPYDNLKAIQNKKSTQIFIVSKEKNLNEIKKLVTFAFMDLNKQQNYYFSVFEILKILCPHIHFEKIILEFTHVMDTMEEGRSISFSQTPSFEEVPEKQPVKNITHIVSNVHYNSIKQLILNTIILLNKNVLSILKKRPFYQFLFLLICVAGIVIILNAVHNKPMQQSPIGELSIRSDLVIPKESALLYRSGLMTKIDDKFKELKGIQTIALVGPGGAGKTTLARHYARQQKAPVVWEINAETKENFLMSFEELSFRLSQSEEDKRELQEIRDITNPIEKEKRLIFFLKSHLRLYPNWFLIYDNLELFPDFLKYFPCDSSEWGNGRILVTTRDGTLQDTTYVNLENIIPLGELKKQEAAELFIKILYDPQPLSLTKKEKVLAFLQNIPSYPLDVSVAAYYIKNSHITPEIYLERIAQPCKKFEGVQEAIAKGVGEYAKTRYRVITLSLERLTTVDPDFADLCLFISMLDSQNIPRELLDKYKNPVVVDNFIYTLNKYSLINPGAQGSSAPNVSLHRSIQKIMLTHFSEAFGIEKTKEKIQRMASQMETYADTIAEKEDRTTARLLINHYEMFLSHQNLLDHSVILLISGELGNLYYCVKDFIKAEQLLEKSTDASDKYYDPIRSIKFLLNLSKTYVQVDDTKKIKKLCDHLLMIYQKFLPKSDVTSALVLTSLGNMYDSLADFKTAREFVQQGLQIYRKHYPEGFFKEALLLGILGNIWMKTEDFTKAKELIEEGISQHRKYFPEDQMRIAWLSICLGNAYIGLGDYNKAKEFLETGVKLYTQHFSENHIATSWASVYLAHAYIKLKDYKKAQVLLEKDLIIYRKNFPANHDGLIRNKTYLIDAYMCLENYEKAKPLLEETLLGVEQRYGKEHMKFAYLLQYLGKIYFIEGQTELATTTFQKALKVFLKNKSPESYKCLESLSDVLVEQSSMASIDGDHKQAQKLKIQAVEYLKKALEGVADPSTHARLQDKLKKLE